MHLNTQISEYDSALTCLFNALIYLYKKDEIPLKLIKIIYKYTLCNKTKTIGEWVRGKMRRGLPDRAEDAWNEVLNLDFFFRYNIKTKEKVEYAKRLLEEYDD